MKFFKKKCYVMIAYAPHGMSLSDADIAFNNFISDETRGMVLFHDHFVGRPGAIALFYIDSGRELEALQKKGGPLNEWEMQVFSLTFAEIPIEFLYQIDFTMGVYRGKRLRELYEQYSGSEYEKNVDGHMDERQQ